MRILGTGSCLPERRVTNDELAKFLDTSDEWITTRTGIKERRIMGEGETFELLASRASERALSQAKVRADELDFIVCSCVYNDYMTPAMACIVQGMIGAGCPAMDINGACAGFVYALFTAQCILKQGAKKVLVVAVESPAKMSDWTDRSTCVLFGEGAGAVVLSSEGEDMSFELTANSRTEVLYAFNPAGNIPFGGERRPAVPLQMKGQEVYKFAVNAASGGMKRLLAQKGLTPDNADFFLLHQANKRIIDSVRIHLKQPESKFPTNVERYGNTSSASLPILLDEVNRGGLLKEGDLIAMSAFGAGLVAGCALVKWNVTA